MPAPHRPDGRRSIRRLLATCTATWLMLAPVMAGAAGPTPTPAAPPATTTTPTLSPAQTERLRHLSEELRCLVCQNQSLADSNADLAVDLRNQVRDMVAQDLDDARIKAYLVDRYGDFVLFKPPVQGNTWFLWIGPFVLLAIGLLIWSRLGRRRADPALGATATIGSSAPMSPGGTSHDPQAPPTTGSSRDPTLAAARRLLDDPGP